MDLKVIMWYVFLIHQPACDIQNWWNINVKQFVSSDAKHSLYINQSERHFWNIYMNPTNEIDTINHKIKTEKKKSNHLENLGKLNWQKF